MEVIKKKKIFKKFKKSSKSQVVVVYSDLDQLRVVGCDAESLSQLTN